MTPEPIVELVSNGHWLVRTSTGEFLDIEHDPHTGAPRLHTVPLSRVRHAFRVTRVADEHKHAWQVMLDPVALDGHSASSAPTTGHGAAAHAGHAASIGAAAATPAHAVQLPMRMTHHGCLNFEVAALPHAHAQHAAAGIAAQSTAQSVGAMALSSFLATPAAADLSLSLKVDLPKLATTTSGIPFPAFTGESKLAFEYIARELRCKDLRSDLLKEATLNSLARPTHIQQYAWDAVVRQLHKEIGRRDEVDLFFRPLRDFVTFVFIDQAGLIEQVGDHVTLEGSQVMHILVHGFLKAVASGVGKLPFDGSGLVSAALQGGVELLLADRSLSAEDLAVAKASARDSMSTLFNSLQTAIMKARKRVMEDWGLLQAMGDAIRAGDAAAKWPEPDEDEKMRVAARKLLEIELWKLMLKLKWHHITPSDDPAFFKAYGQAQKDAYEASNPHYWVEFAPGSQSDTLGKTQQGILVRYHWLGYGSSVFTHHEPSHAMCDRLFTQLGVSKQEVFTDTAWGLTHESFSVPSTMWSGM